MEAATSLLMVLLSLTQMDHLTGVQRRLSFGVDFANRISTSLEIRTELEDCDPGTDVPLLCYYTEGSLYLFHADFSTYRVGQRFNFELHGETFELVPTGQSLYLGCAEIYSYRLVSQDKSEVLAIDFGITEDHHLAYVDFIGFGTTAINLDICSNEWWDIHLAGWSTRNRK